MNNKDYSLLGEMKSNCIHGDNYHDPKAIDKYQLLCKLQFLAEAYVLSIESQIEINLLKLKTASGDEVHLIEDHIHTLKSILSRLESDSDEFY